MIRLKFRYEKILEDVWLVSLRIIGTINDFKNDFGSDYFFVLPSISPFHFNLINIL